MPGLMNQAMNQLAGLGRPPKGINELEAERLQNQLSQQQLQLNQQQLQDYPEEQKWKQEARQQQRKTWTRADEEYTRTLDRRGFKDEQEGLDWLMNYAPLVTYENYDSVKERLQKWGVSKDMFPDRAMFVEAAQELSERVGRPVSPNEVFEMFKKTSLQTAAERMERLKAELKKKEQKEVSWQSKGETEKGYPLVFNPVEGKEYVDIEGVKTPYEPKIHGGRLRTPAAQVTVDLGKMTYGEVLKELPKLRGEADTAKTGLTSINRALELIKGGGVTGKMGQFKAFISPYAEALGVDDKTLNTLGDAETFQLLTRVIVGPMRLEIIGAGPVSDYEQALMTKVSGGGGTGKRAAVELLSHWQRRAKNKMNLYNNTLKGAATLNKDIENVYRPIEEEPGKAPEKLIHFEVGTDEYYIPKEKEDAFIKKYPKAIRMKE